MKKKYTIIYADPAWQYKDRALAGKRGAGCKYRVNSDQAIIDLPVRQIAADNAWLFIWVTMPKIFVAQRVIESWGFKYKTNAFTWVKRNKSGKGWFWGLGHYTRANTELCLLATRGKVKRISARVHSVIDTPIQGHSQKPQEARKRILELCGDLPRVELFARGSVPGWDTLGDESEDGRTLEEALSS
ncbi:MAG: MT-A70 family methyltransferase [Rhodobacter sp.]|nr:MT-A70 family methyltransferase [Rhodobacter sp.]